MHDVISETTNAEARQFDFLEGEWNAICRFPLPDGSWGEGPGSLTASKVLAGCVFLLTRLRETERSRRLQRCSLKKALTTCRLRQRTMNCWVWNASFRTG